MLEDVDTLSRPFMQIVVGLKNHNISGGFNLEVSSICSNTVHNLRELYCPKAI